MAERKPLPGDRPVCECHGEPMSRTRGGWRCGVVDRERKRAHYAANRERELERVRAYDAANREKIRARKRAHYEANREQALERSSAYYEANREQVLERVRAYQDRPDVRLRRMLYEMTRVRTRY